MKHVIHVAIVMMLVLLSAQGTLLAEAESPEPGSAPYLVSEQKAAGADFRKVSLFDQSVGLEAVFGKSHWQAYSEAGEVLADATLTRLDPQALSTLRHNAPKTWTLRLPFQRAETGGLDVQWVAIIKPSSEIAALCGINVSGLLYVCRSRTPGRSRRAQRGR